MEKLKFAIKCILTFAILLVGLIALLLMSGSLCDKTSVKGNAYESFRILSYEGDYNRSFIPFPIFQRDNFTDAIMISASVAEYNGLDGLENVFYSPIYQRVDTTSMTNSCYQISMHPDSEQAHVKSYARYWHGYKLVLSPLLSIVDIKGIRLINCMICVLMFLCAAYLIYIRLGKAISAIFVLSMLLTGFPLLTSSMQYVTCYAISFVGIIVMAALPQAKTTQNDVIYLLFMIIGALTSFFDLLTTPIMTFGLPVLVIQLRRDKFPGLKWLIACGLMWMIGYAGMWMVKWVLTGLFIPKDIISIVSVVTESIINRSGHISILDYKGKGIVLLAILIGMLILSLLMVYGLKRKFGLDCVKRYSSLILVGLLPFLWVLAMQNHSFFHYWFVWRIFSVSIMGFGAFYYKMIKCDM